MTVAITRADVDALDLRAAATSKDTAAARSMLGLASVMNGQTHVAGARAAA